jgi:acyl-CoA hydrolase
VAFGSPIRNGEVVTLEATVTRAFNTSLEIYVQATAATMQGENPRRTHSAYFTFVALDKDNGSPTSVPTLVPLTEIEEQRFGAALRRRELRLVMAGRMKPAEATNLRELFR